MLRRRSSCLRCSGGTGMRGPGSLVRPGPRSPASISMPFSGSWPKRRLGRRGKRGRRRRGGGRGGLAGLCSAALRDVSYDSLLGGSMAPCICQSLICRWACWRSTIRGLFWEMTSGCAVFSSSLGSTVDTCVSVYASVSSPEEYVKIGTFLGDDFWIYSCVQCFLVRQWIQFGVSPRGRAGFPC